MIILAPTPEETSVIASWGGGISLILGLFALVALVAAVVAYARVALTKSTVEVLSESNRALTERLDIMERDKTRQDTEIGRLQGEILKLAGENQVLRSVVSGTEAIKSLSELIIQETRHRQHEHHDIMSLIQADAQVTVTLLEELKHLAHSHDKGS